MNEKQTEVKKVKAQPEMLPAIVEWGLGFSLILACVAVGSIALHFSLSFIGLIMGGIIGGIIIGFMPYVAQRFRISRIGWQAVIFANLTLITVSLIISANYLYQEAITAQTHLEENGIHSTTVYSQFEFRLTFLIIFFVLGSLTGMIVSLITRWVCRRWLKSQASWWVWTIATILIIVIMFFNLFLAAFMFSQ